MHLNLDQPMQPGLRSFIVYETLPFAAEPFRVMDNWNRPHIEAGEIIAYDPEDCEPVHGEMYVMKWDHAPRAEIAQVLHIPALDCWGTGSSRPGPDGGKLIRVGDFGYDTAEMTRRILGRVIGIIENERVAA